jgi:type IV pilus assembly protein PilE
MERDEMKIQKGFTLIELMVAIVIVAVLASIAIPSYREYVKRSHRRAAQAVMMEIANQQHQYFAANRAYASDTDLGYTLPPEVDDHYNLAITRAAGPPPTFTISLTATGSQVTDGNLSLDSQGVRTPANKW